MERRRFDHAGRLSAGQGSCSAASNASPWCSAAALLRAHQVSHAIGIGRVAEGCSAAHLIHGSLHGCRVGLLSAHLAHTRDLAHGCRASPGSSGFCGSRVWAGVQPA